jgi:transcriptional regulator with PAS, ATPase and Fis domain
MDEGRRVLGGVETFRDLTLVEALRREVEKSFTFEDIISRNQRMQEIFSILPDVALSDSTILIEGDSGTGKELMAKQSTICQAGGPSLVIVNCGAIPDALLESELFGYKAGAFTGANRDKPGRFAQADGGTIFLDEIGDVSPALQVRLLRVLQDKSFQPLGGTQTQTSDVRVLAATNKDVRAMLQEGKFRQDLYYRIQVFKLSLPPLRERREDIPLLAQHFADRLNRLKGKDITGLSRERWLHSCTDWPGNIRELENSCARSYSATGLDRCSTSPPPLRAQARRGRPADGLTLAEIEARVIRKRWGETGRKWPQPLNWVSKRQLSGEISNASESITIIRVLVSDVI